MPGWDGRCPRRPWTIRRCLRPRGRPPPARGPSAVGRHVVGLEPCPDEGPRDERVRVPHLARSGRATAPRERRGATHGAQEPPDRGGVARDDDGRPDGVLPVGDRSVRPAAHLVPEPAGAPERPQAHGTGHHDAPVDRRAAPRGGHLDDVRHPVAPQPQRRVEQRAGTPSCAERGGTLPRGARATHDVAPAPTGSQRSSARSPPGVVAVTPRRYGTRTRTGPVGSGHASGVRAPAGSE